MRDIVYLRVGETNHDDSGHVSYGKGSTGDIFCCIDRTVIRGGVGDCRPVIYSRGLRGCAVDDCVSRDVVV